MSTPSPAQVALIIGRWQIFHKGHKALLRHALASAPLVVIAIGSAYRARDPKNPFTWSERAQMIQMDLTEAEIARVRFLPIRDYYDDTRWNAAMREGVARLAPGVNDITLVGFKKDHTSYYLDNFQGWKFQVANSNLDLDATGLRSVYFETAEPEVAQALLSEHVEPGALAWLGGWRKLGWHALVAAEFKQLREEIKSIAPGSIGVGVDALIECGEKVLLIQRARGIGKGNWALPGVMLRPNERVFQAALRALEEEAGFRKLPSTMRGRFKSEAIFDHPGRSARGRLISHTLHFDFRDMPEDELRAGAGASNALWVPIHELPSMEERLFEDHGAILDHHVGLFPVFPGNQREPGHAANGSQTKGAR